jgi:hypothetical protein
VPVVEHALNSSPRPMLNGCSPLEVWSGRPARRALDIVVSQGDRGLELVPLDHGELARLTADMLTDIRDEIRTGVIEVSQRLGQRARDKANEHRPRALKLVESDEVMVAEVDPRNKVAARWTGPHEVVRCLSAHRYEVRNIVTGKTTTVHASRLEHYDDAAVGASADGRVRQQVAHETFGFQVARLGGHRRAEDGLGWELRPVWRGFEDAEESQQWRALGDAFKGLPTMVLRYIRRLLRGGKDQAAAGESMCHQLELDAEHIKTCPLRELVGETAVGDEDA